ncbi:hypothetical protein F4703DRAFT_1593342 [Phycomyces blakesleeanus]
MPPSRTKPGPAFELRFCDNNIVQVYDLTRRQKPAEKHLLPNEYPIDDVLKGRLRYSKLGNQRLSRLSGGSSKFQAFQLALSRQHSKETLADIETESNEDNDEQLKDRSNLPTNKSGGNIGIDGGGNKRRRRRERTRTTGSKSESESESEFKSKSKSNTKDSIYPSTSNSTKIPVVVKRQIEMDEKELAEIRKGQEAVRKAMERKAKIQNARKNAKRVIEKEGLVDTNDNEVCHTNTRPALNGVNDLPNNNNHFTCSKVPEQQTVLEHSSGKDASDKMLYEKVTLAT